ncbi:zinc finger CCHC domain-containing protein 8 [Brachionichthys hirsutus]|uniref:zinc finger CCHC domain-containing protein 8 n=1 Tax=Brachionichthys hirsutus TaxID=412623 RepID=UPI00360457E8
MADIEFGDSELFQQLDDYAPRIATHIHFTNDEDDQEEKNQLRSRLEECDEYIERLVEENKSLRRKQNILTRPSNIAIENVNIDGPVLQIIYTNNAISKQCRQEIEDCICSVIWKHQKPCQENKQSTFQMKPQNSAFALDEDPQKSLTSSVRTTTEAFKVVGSVSYFTTFSLDKLGQPLVNENPQLTDGWDVPIYIQIFNQIIGTDGQEVEMKDRRSKSLCFNCGLSGHQLRDCPKPKDMAAINERRKEFNQNNNQAFQSNQRYHADEVEERFAKYKPGVVSKELLTALGIDGNTLPPLIYRMRQLGYPPGWLKVAEMENSGLNLYDGKFSYDGDRKDNTNLQDISYDVSKLIDFPGFNIPAPNKMKDEFMHYGSVPMQSNHMKENYAAYLSNNYATSSSTCNKRCLQSDSSPQLKKRSRLSPNGSSDMDIESDPGIPYPHDFHFQPPFPPGSPCFSSPPPLPQGTPPSTPTRPPLPKGTPPLTPTNGSPALRGRNSGDADETVAATEDDLTLEELEEQQRLIWAALEKADTATNSDCETPVMGTPAPSSPSVSTSTHTETEEETMDKIKPAESYDSSANQKESVVQDICSHKLELPKDRDDSPQNPEPVKKQEDTPQSPGPVKEKDNSPQSPGPVHVRDDSPQSPCPIKFQEDKLQIPVPDFGVPGDCASPDHLEKITAVPHRSNFAAGIVQFEDTPEFTEVAAATGTYLKIRDLLKGSPRNLIKKS